jgi:hypothetical protein
MGIAVKFITRDEAATDAPASRTLEATQITLGSHEEDSVRLNADTLQGCRLRLLAQCHQTTGETRLLASNLSDETDVIIGGQRVSPGESQAVTRHTEIQLGEYRFTAELLTDELPAKPAQHTVNNTLNSGKTTNEADAKDATLDSAVQSLLQLSQPQKNTETTEPQPEPARQSTPTNASTNKDTSTPKPTTKPIISAVSDSARSKHSAPRKEKTPAPRKPLNNAASADNSPYATTDQVLFEHVAGVDDIDALDFYALQLLTIRGRISHHGNPMPGLAIDGGELGNTTTDNNGEFRFDNIVEGTRYQISVSHDGYLMSGTDVLSGILTAHVNANLTATRLTLVQGRLTHNGKPLAGVQIDAGRFGSCVTDDAGHYCFRDIPEGTKVTLAASGSGYTFRPKHTHAGKVRSTPAPVPAAATAIRRPPEKPQTTPTTASAPQDELAASLAILTGAQTAAA